MCDDESVKLYTGLSSYAVLMIVFEFVASAVPDHHRSKLPKFSQFLMVLMKLRLNLLDSDLARRFGVSQSTVSKPLLQSTFQYQKAGIALSSCGRGPANELLLLISSLTTQVICGWLLDASSRGRLLRAVARSNFCHPEMLAIFILNFPIVDIPLSSHHRPIFQNFFLPCSSTPKCHPESSFPFLRCKEWDQHSWPKPEIIVLFQACAPVSSFNTG